VSVRVLVCDDHPVYRRGLRTLLDELGGIEVVGEATDGDDALAQVARTSPDVVIMDLHLPGISGVEATRRLVSAHPRVGVLVLTMFEDDTSLAAALRAGARGYLVKGADHEEISRAILAVARGEALLGQTVSGRLARALGPPTPSRTFPELTTRELEVLELAASGLSNQEIAARLFLAPKTVRNNVSGVLTKLGVSSRAEAAARARDAGVGSAAPPGPVPEP
jgi:DNA-binding NarL/FixJ family response regulator